MFLTPLVNRKPLFTPAAPPLSSEESETVRHRTGKRGERPKPYREGIQSPAVARILKRDAGRSSGASGRVADPSWPAVAPTACAPSRAERCAELTKSDALRMFLPATPDNHRSPPL